MIASIYDADLRMSRSWEELCSENKQSSSNPLLQISSRINLSLSEASLKSSTHTNHYFQFLLHRPLIIITKSKELSKLFIISVKWFHFGPWHSHIAVHVFIGNENHRKSWREDTEVALAWVLSTCRAGNAAENELSGNSPSRWSSSPTRTNPTWRFCLGGLCLRSRVNNEDKQVREFIWLRYWTTAVRICG